MLVMTEEKGNKKRKEEQPTEKGKKSTSHKWTISGVVPTDRESQDLSVNIIHGMRKLTWAREKRKLRYTSISE